MILCGHAWIVCSGTESALSMRAGMRCAVVSLFQSRFSYCFTSIITRINTKYMHTTNDTIPSPHAVYRKHSIHCWVCKQLMYWQLQYHTNYPQHNIYSACHIPFSKFTSLIGLFCYSAVNIHLLCLTRVHSVFLRYTVIEICVGIGLSRPINQYILIRKRT